MNLNDDLGKMKQKAEDANLDDRAKVELKKRMNRNKQEEVTDQD
jgi:hypothetical protein